MILRKSRAALSRVIGLLRGAPLWSELRRLNRMGIGAGANPDRATRGAAFRAALARKYRNRAPCC